MTKSFLRMGVSTESAISSRNLSSPRKYFGSVSTEIAEAPADAYSLAMSRYGKSSLMTPLDGDAFLTSHIRDIPSDSSVLSKGNPVRLGRTLLPSITSLIGLMVRSKFTLRRVSATMLSSIVDITSPP